MFAQPGKGYDMAITQFSPEGRLFQVEYAIEAVRRGTTAIVCKNDGSVVFAVEKKFSKLQEPWGSEKIFKIDDHIGIAISGLTADARVLIDKARLQSQINILSYDEKISIKDVTLHICEQKQAYTQNAGVRPFGVSFLIGGIDSFGPSIYLTDPSGASWGYKAQAIGSGATEARSFLEKNYKDNLSDEELLLLPIKAIREIMGDDLTPNTCDIGVIMRDERIFKMLNEKEKNELLLKV